MGKPRLTSYVSSHALLKDSANDRQTHKDLPSQFLSSSKPIEANLVLGSFGLAKGYNDRVFSLHVATDSNVPIPSTAKPLRYGKLPEIHHIFKTDAKSPNVLFSLFFTGAVLATLPAIFGLVSSLSLHNPGADSFSTVAVPWRQSQPSLNGFSICTHLTCPF